MQKMLPIDSYICLQKQISIKKMKGQLARRALPAVLTNTFINI